jgi:hypothetical protein
LALFAFQACSNENALNRCCIGTLKQSAAQAAQAEFSDRGLEVGDGQMGIGQYSMMQRYLVRLTRLLVLIGLVVSPLLAQAAWTEASSRHFVLIAEDEPERLREFAQRLERFDQAVRHIGQLPDEELAPVNRITVYLDSKFGVVAETVRPDVISFYRARTTGAVAVVARDRTVPSSFSQRLVFLRICGDRQGRERLHWLPASSAGRQPCRRPDPH